MTVRRLVFENMRSQNCSLSGKHWDHLRRSMSCGSKDAMPSFHASGPLYPPDQRTSMITIISSEHGRMRHEESDIDKRDLQQALKYGTRELTGGGSWKMEG